MGPRDVLSLATERNDARAATRVRYGALPYRFAPLAALEILCYDATIAAVGLEGSANQRLTPSKFSCARSVRRPECGGRWRKAVTSNFRYKKAADANGADVDCEVKSIRCSSEGRARPGRKLGSTWFGRFKPQTAISLDPESS